MNGKWIVNTKGGAGKSSFEIVVVRDDNRHGLVSYGWIDENKLLISESAGPWSVTPFVWERLMKVAQETADHLNSTEV